MRAFTDLYVALDETTKTSVKVRALVEYFRVAAPVDAAWAIYFLSGRKPRQVVPMRKLAAWAATEAGVSDWLYDDSYDAVGDSAETMALLLPEPVATTGEPLHVWVEDRLLPLREAPEVEQQAAILNAWRSMDHHQRFVWNKLITGAFRVGVAQSLVVRALAEASGLPAPVIAHRLMGEWQPTERFFRRLMAQEVTDTDHSRPYPFFLAHPLESEPVALGPITDWQAEWKWDGIRSQLIKRRGDVFLWTRGEQLVTDRYPELRDVGKLLPNGTVIDGEVLPWQDDRPLPFAQLQRRIGRKTITKKTMTEVPVVLLAYDVLELREEDVRSQPQHARRRELEELVRRLDHPRLKLSPMVHAATWEGLASLRSESRARFVEGLMLKRLDAPYRVGRVRGDWWKWKIHPLTMDAVLIYAQRGSGKRASLYTDYTFGVWHEGKLVPCAKAYSGLTDEEIRQVDNFVRHNTLEKFGPVRTVKPELVFELGFEAIQPSPRHKSGIAVRFPRMLRWRTDKQPADADSLENLFKLIPQAQPTPLPNEEA